MIALFSAVFLSSLLGSTHCAGMCGAFVAFAVGTPDLNARTSSRLTLNAAYNGGRLVTYLLLGVLAGILGATLDLGGALIGVQRIAACGAGAMMIGVGVAAILRHYGVPVSRIPSPAFLTRLARVGHERAFRMTPVMRAGTVGLLTTLLPCGWLYAFVIIAAGTASPLWGLLVMGAFWFGTIPIMATVGFGVQAISGPLRARLPLVTSVVLVGAGIWTLAGRIAMPPILSRAAAAPVSVQQWVDRASHVENDCPLCNPEHKKEP